MLTDLSGLATICDCGWPDAHRLCCTALTDDEIAALTTTTPFPHDQGGRAIRRWLDDVMPLTPADRRAIRIRGRADRARMRRITRRHHGHGDHLGHHHVIVLRTPAYTGLPLPYYYCGPGQCGRVWFPGDPGYGRAARQHRQQNPNR